MAIKDLGPDDENLQILPPASSRKSLVSDYLNHVTKIEDGIMKDLGANSGGLKGGTFQSNKLETKTDFARKYEITSLKLKRNQRVIGDLVKLAINMDIDFNNSKLFGIKNRNYKIDITIKVVQEIDKSELLGNLKTLFDLGATNNVAILAEYLQIGNDAAYSMIKKQKEQEGALIKINPIEEIKVLTEETEKISTEQKINKNESSKKNGN